MADDISSAVDDAEGYLVKHIQFGLLNVRIITQEGDGPCPLIAIANVLLLRGALSLPHAESWISHGTLVQVLRDYALELNRVPPGSSEEVRANIEANVEASVRILCSKAMRRGIMINPSLTGVTSFEFTPEIGVFDLFRIRLLHGWLVEPTDSEGLRRFFEGRSYNQIQDAISAVLHSSPSDAQEQAALASAWFAQHATQMTAHGVKELERNVMENEISVLFRADHFSTIIKHNGQLYSLVSAHACEKLRSVTNQKVMTSSWMELGGHSFQRRRGGNITTIFFRGLLYMVEILVHMTVTFDQFHDDDDDNDDVHNEFGDTRLYCTDLMNSKVERKYFSKHLLIGGTDGSGA